MKKVIGLLMIALLLGIVCIYYFIPNPIVVTASEQLGVNAKGFSRSIGHTNTWNKWWPGTVSVDGAQLQYQNTRFNITGQKFSSVLLQASADSDDYYTELFFLPVQPDSVLLKWTSLSAASLNPITRWKQYRKSQQLKTQIQALLQRAKDFYSQEKNIYGVSIQKDVVHDSTLISTATTFKGYPSTSNIYSLVDKLKTFASERGALPTGLPMLNVYTTDSVSFLTKVALPVDKKLSDAGDVQYRWMLGGGNILVTEVTGGPSTINKGFEQMGYYIEDHRRMAPAIPYQSLITNRLQEPDTSKWVTRLYWPVM